MMRNACTGSCKVYFPNESSMFYCPKCGGSLSSIQDNKKFTACSYDKQTNTVTPLSTKKSSPFQALQKTEPKNNKRVFNNETRHVYEPTPSPQKRSNQPAASKQNNFQPTVSAYSGRISSYNHEEMPQPLLDRISFFFRGLHCGTTRHTITFTNEVDSRTYQVIYYGAYRSTSPTPTIGDTIRVDSKPNGNLFNTENVYLGAGSGRRIRMSTQHEERHRYRNEHTGFGRIILFALLAFAAVVLGYLFFPQISGIINTYISVLFVVFLAWLFIRPLQRLIRNPAWLLGISVVLTAAFYNVGGLGTVLSSMLSPLITLGVVVSIASYFLRRS